MLLLNPLSIVLFSDSLNSNLIHRFSVGGGKFRKNPFFLFCFRGRSLSKNLNSFNFSRIIFVWGQIIQNLSVICLTLWAENLLLSPFICLISFVISNILMLIWVGLTALSWWVWRWSFFCMWGEYGEQEGWISVSLVRYSREQLGEMEKRNQSLFWFPCFIMLTL